MARSKERPLKSWPGQPSVLRVSRSGITEGEAYTLQPDCSYLTACQCRPRRRGSISRPDQHPPKAPPKRHLAGGGCGVRQQPGTGQQQQQQQREPPQESHEPLQPSAEVSRPGCPPFFAQIRHQTTNTNLGSQQSPSPIAPVALQGPFTCFWTIQQAPDGCWISPIGRRHCMGAQRCDGCLHGMCCMTMPVTSLNIHWP